MRPRLSAKSVQRIGRLSIKVHVFEDSVLKGQVFVTLPHTRRPLASHARRANAGAGQTVTLRFKWPRANLKRIKAALTKRRLRARIYVTSRNAEGAAETQAKTVRLKP